MRKFGLLKYSTFNLGDQIQSVAAERFLPRIDQHIDREALDEGNSGADLEPVKLIMNGWFCHRPDKWPPAEFIDPLLISFHITDLPGEGSGLRAREHFPTRPAVIDYLRGHGPVGARDLSTLDLLRSWGVDSYFSGCLTLTLNRAAVARQDGLVVLCDVPDAVAVVAARSGAAEVRRTAHRDEITTGVEARMARARELIALYSAASCVVTTRLHCALPCLAIGTPVLLLDEAPDKYRFTGLIDLVHHCSAAAYVAAVFRYPIADPPPNPTAHLALRGSLELRAEAFVAGQVGRAANGTSAV